MDDVVACPACGTRMRVPGNLGTQQAQCPKCDRVFTPRPEASQAVAPTAAPAPQRRDRDYYDEDDWEDHGRSRIGDQLAEHRLLGQGRAKASRVFLMLSIPAGLFSIIQSWLFYIYVTDVEKGAAPDEQWATILDSMAGIGGLIELGLLIAGGLAICFWTHSAYSNLRVLNVFGNRFTPGWAVAYYFIPVLSLYRPLQVMQELWKTSDAESLSSDGWMERPRSALAGWWWAFWLISGVLGQISTRIAWSGDVQIPALKIMSITVILSQIASIFAALCLFSLIGSVMTRQKEKLNRLAADEGGAHY